MATLLQMTFDLMGVNSNAYEEHFGGLKEDGVKEFYIRNNISSLARVLYQKIKFCKYMCGDMDEAARHYDLQQELNANCAVQATTGESGLYNGLGNALLLSSILIGTLGTTKTRANFIFLGIYIH